MNSVARVSPSQPFNDAFDATGLVPLLSAASAEMLEGLLLKESNELEKAAPMADASGELPGSSGSDASTQEVAAVLDQTQAGAAGGPEATTPAAVQADEPEGPPPPKRSARRKRKKSQLPASVRAKNREAQTRFRLRQKDKVEQTLRELEQLQAENKELLDHIAALELELNCRRQQVPPSGLPAGDQWQG